MSFYITVIYESIVIRTRGDGKIVVYKYNFIRN